MRIPPGIRAAKAIEALTSEPLILTGRIKESMNSGKLIGSRSNDELNRLDNLLSTGIEDQSTRRIVGEGMNNSREAVVLHGADNESITAVTKPESAQGAQEHLSWLVAKAIGIDHLVAPVGRASDGTARIAYVEGSSLTSSGVRNAKDLEVALTQAHLQRTEGLTDIEAAQAGRIESQLVSVFDYLLANSDRHGGNGLVNAKSGVIQLIDQGHLGRGQAGRSDILKPGLRETYLNTKAGVVNLDASVIKYLKEHVSEESLADAHKVAMRGKNSPSTSGQFGNFNFYAASDQMRDGMIARLKHLKEQGKFSFDTPGETMVAPLRAVDDPPLRGGLAQARFGHGGLGPMF